MSRKVILIAGGTAGIGLALAKKCLPEYEVVVTGRRSSVEMPDSGHRMVLLQGDIASPDVCQKWIRAAESLGPLAAVVNAAGCNFPPRSVDEMPLDEWKTMLDVHLTGSLLLCQAAIPALRRHGPGASIVLISSRSGSTGYAMPGMGQNKTKANYAAAKAGIMSLSRSLARELAPEGISVNNVAPGPIDTGRLPEHVFDLCKKEIPMGRLGTAEEVADLCYFLCSAQAAYITGQTIHINGGALMT